MTEQMYTDILQQTERYYEEKITKYGASARGVDWKSECDQYTRFEQVSKIIKKKNDFSLVDYGCGYGALINFLADSHDNIEYTGYDLSPSMISVSQQSFGGKQNIKFITGSQIADFAQYCITSGTLNVKQNVSNEKWIEYVKSTLRMLDDKSTLGFSFNLLSAKCENDKKRDDLFYADEHEMEFFCKNNFSKKVTVLSNYGLYEFTVLVDKT